MDPIEKPSWLGAPYYDVLIQISPYERKVWRVNLPLVSREWKNGSNSSYNSTPFLHSLLTKGKCRVC